jgi:hypothetical protein
MPVPAGNSAPQNEHFLFFGMWGHFFLSVDFLGFAFCFSEHEDILDSDWTFDVSGDDASFVSAFEYANSSL